MRLYSFGMDDNIMPRSISNSKEHFMKDNTSYYVILGILSFGECSGYDIKKKIENEIGYFYKVSNGQIYPVLKRLLQQKNASYCVEKNDSKPYRKVYSITDQGYEVLKEWLDRTDYPHNEFLLRLYFGSIRLISKNIDMINDFKAAKERHLETYHGIQEHFNLNTINKQQDYYSYFTLRYGQLMSKAQIEWCNEVVDMLQELDKKNKE
jgi:PadR family transcriptional regulator AphA